MDELSKEDSSEMVLLGLAWLIMAPAMMLLDGFVLWKGWNWFVQPWTGLEPSYWHMVGVSLLVGYAVLSINKSKRQKYKSMDDKWWELYMHPIVGFSFLFLLWVAHLFV